MPFQNDILNIFAQSGISLTSEDVLQYEKFFHLLEKGNERMNLTSITKENEVIVKHFLDSVLPYFLIPEKAKVVDLGSGAGLPGIPIKIVRSDISLTLVECTGKKVTFLNETIAELGIKDIFVVDARVEEYGIKEGRNRFDVATARAVAPLNILLEYALPLLKTNGIFIAYKGPNVTDEIESAKRAAKILGGELSEIKEYSLNSEYERVIVVFKKIKTTDKEYPRENRKILKAPLGQ
jgi:16S rRNA (guanine527-N7)-methyltransferase